MALLSVPQPADREVGLQALSDWYEEVKDARWQGSTLDGLNWV